MHKPSFESNFDADAEYCFPVFSRRWNGYRQYRLRKNQTGWDFSFLSINGHCAPDGADIFYTNLNQDHINYPTGFGGFLQHLWECIHKNEITAKQANRKLFQLAKWVSECERNQPNWIGWNAHTKKVLKANPALTC
jgi:hypothetical protein